MSECGAVGELTTSHHSMFANRGENHEGADGHHVA
jgi:hypothetical protein